MQQRAMRLVIKFCEGWKTKLLVVVNEMARMRGHGHFCEHPTRLWAIHVVQEDMALPVLRSQSNSGEVLPRLTVLSPQHSDLPLKKLDEQSNNTKPREPCRNSVSSRFAPDWRLISAVFAFCKFKLCTFGIQKIVWSNQPSTPNRSIASTEVSCRGGEGEKESLLQLAYLNLPISTFASTFHVRNRRLDIKRSILSALRVLRSLQFDVSSLLGTSHRQAQAALHPSVCGANGTRVTTHCSLRLDRFSITAWGLEARSAQ